MRHFHSRDYQEMDYVGLGYAEWRDRIVVGTDQGLKQMYGLGLRLVKIATKWKIG